MKLTTKIIACAAVAAALAGKADYQTFKCDFKSYVPFDATTTVTLDCPDPAAVKWLDAHFKEWYGDAVPKVAGGRVSPRAEAEKADAMNCVPPVGDEGYSAVVDSSGVKIAANTLAGTRWAAYTLRQLALAKRGTFKTEGRILPKLTIEDHPHLAFRAVHLCCFPETRIQQIERSIRLAALLKFNYAIIESWGMYKSEKHPWCAWPNAYLTKSEIKRLVAIGRDLGITLIPQINCYGHASASRGCTIKHSALDMHPEYEPLFESGGWCWCISNPATQRVLRELIAEIHEDFGNPPYFHIGCDEAFGAQSCPECVKTPHAELAVRHFNGLSEFLKARGAKAMMWHDMLLDKKDPRWNGFVKFGGSHATEILDKLQKDIVICDWQYSYGNMKEKRKDWPTMTYFKGKGFPVAGCPWRNYDAMKPMADHIAKIGGFGLIETTWHHLRGKEWEKMYMSAAYAAWGSPVSHGVSFERSLRLVGNDMKVDDYLDTGYLNYQVPPGWWISND